MNGGHEEITCKVFKTINSEMKRKTVELRKTPQTISGRRTLTSSKKQSECDRLR